MVVIVCAVVSVCVYSGFLMPDMTTLTASSDVIDSDAFVVIVRTLLE